MQKNITILYVEDEDVIRENTKRPLTRLCDTLIVASDGQEGLNLYKKYRPDIVVSDIKMPNMNGIEMCRAIKNIDKDQHIVFTTAHSECGYFMDAIDMQIDCYILKPIDYDLLENKANKIIDTISNKYKLRQQEILINEIAKLQDNLLIVLDCKQNIVFSNDRFLHFFDVNTLDDFKETYSILSSLFIEGEDFFTACNENWLLDLQKLPKKEQVVSIMNKALAEPQVFLVSVKEISETSHTILILTEITHIADETKELKQKAFTDDLTSIYNRAYFNKMLIKQMQDNQDCLSLILLDVDRFKDFNDVYGHQVGDKVLQSLASIINAKIRTADIFARWGGEEFTIILSDTNLANALKVAENLRQTIEEYIFIGDLKVTCSFGVAEATKEDVPDTLIKRADDALYRAKTGGRNRVAQ